MADIKVETMRQLMHGPGGQLGGKGCQLRKVQTILNPGNQRDWQSYLAQASELQQLPASENRSTPVSTLETLSHHHHGISKADTAGPEGWPGAVNAGDPREKCCLPPTTEG